MAIGMFGDSDLTMTSGNGDNPSSILLERTTGPTLSESVTLMTQPAFAQYATATLQYFTIAAFSGPMPSNANDDAYLLVLLADQEAATGRDNQVESLLDAAYAAFDRT